MFHLKTWIWSKDLGIQKGGSTWIYLFIGTDILSGCAHTWAGITDVTMAGKRQSHTIFSGQVASLELALVPWDFKTGGWCDWSLRKKLNTNWKEERVKKRNVFFYSLEDFGPSLFFKLWKPVLHAMGIHLKHLLRGVDSLCREICDCRLNMSWWFMLWI